MKSLGHNKRSHQLHERIGLEPFHAAGTVAADSDEGCSPDLLDGY